MISKIDELNNISNLPLKDVVFKGNPFALENPTEYDTNPQEKKPEDLFPEIKKRLPFVEIIDGDTV